MDKTLLFNPVGLVHDRHVKIFEDHLPGWGIRRIYNPKNRLFANKKNRNDDNIYYFRKGRPPAECFKDVRAIVLFTAQPRIYPCGLIEEAAFRRIPVVAVEEVYQMMFEQGVVNEYLLPVDRLFAGSDYERDAFIRTGVPSEAVETTGCVFRRKRPRAEEWRGTGRIKDRLGLTPGKRVATLCLAYLTPSGETLEIRKGLLSLVSRGLPAGYELVVKPHPAEQTKDVAPFISGIAPAAKIAGSDVPIDDILDFTDVLINRGNSQVIMDAIQRGVPVIVSPHGRKTLFHGLLDDVIADEPADIAKILGMIGQRGMSIYEPVFTSYKLISPEEALRRTMGRLRSIAEDRELYRPDKRLIEIVMFWAAMGYPSRAISVIKRIRKALSVDAALLQKLYMLVLNKAAIDDVGYIKKWLHDGCKDWLLSSLWVRCLYSAGRKVRGPDIELFDAFPPKMNKEFFMPFAVMLGWCYARSGMHDRAERLIGGLAGEGGRHAGLERLEKNVRKAAERRMCADYHIDRLMYIMKGNAKNIIFQLGIT